MTTLNRQVAAGADDGSFDAGAGTGYSNTGTNFVVGDASASVYNKTVFLRFTNVTIAQGATVSAATLTIPATGGNVTPFQTVHIRAEAADNPTAVTSRVDGIGRTKTTANVSWSGMTAITTGNYTTADISSVIQEVVNRAGWASGNALQIFLSSDSTSFGTAWQIAFANFNSATSSPATLNVTYSTGVTAVTATASAAANTPAVSATSNGTVAAVAATATAAAGIPAISDGSAAPVFVASAGAQGGSTATSLTPTIPGSVSAGHYGIIVSICGNPTGPATAPAGWSTLVSDTLTATGSTRFSVFAREFVAGDANPTVTWASAPASSNNTCILAFWYSGVGSATVGSIGLSSTASTAWTAPSVTTTTASHKVLAVSGVKGSGTGWGSIASWSPDATMRASQYATGNYYPSCVVGDFGQASAGATNAQTATWNYSTASAFAFQIDLAPVATGATVNAVVGTATAAGLAPGTGSAVSNFPPVATASAMAQPGLSVDAGTAVSGGGPMTATAAMLAPGAGIKMTLAVRATATAAGIAPAPPSSSNIITAMVATADAFAPTVTGGGYVAAVVATATADALAPSVSGDVLAVAATATASGIPPAIGQSTVRAPVMVATAMAPAPVAGSIITTLAAAATADFLPPIVEGAALVLAIRALASGQFTPPGVGHKEWVFRTPNIKIHYRTGDPLFDRVGYPTGTAVLLIDGFYVNVDYPDDSQIKAATKSYLGGRDYILSPDELVSLTTAGYSEYISQEVFF